MKNITYFNAGAGSGKTYRLTHVLADLIKGGLNPSSVILTTFTESAAADFRERARSVLYEEGLYDMATLLDQAEIGTVHSISYDFTRKYWYLLGLSPEMNVLDDDSKKFYTNQSVANLPSEEDLSLFSHFQKTFNLTKSGNYNNYVAYTDFWKDWLSSIISMKRTYRVHDMKRSLEYSLEQLRAIFKPSVHFDFDPARFLPLVREINGKAAVETSKVAKDRCEACHKLLVKHHWYVADFKDFAGLLNKAPKGYKLQGIDNAKAELEQIWHSHELFDLIENVVTRLASLADEWTMQYENYKKEKRIIDFDDMEKYMLQLLDDEKTRDVVAKEIQGHYKVLMVDEFQDSSPIQVNIFNRLSELMEQSYWCGDSKQAIYGFRGSDTRLTEAVVEMLPQDDVETLDTSYRSEPDIVNFCNEVFVKAFDGILDEKKVRLKEHRPKETEGSNLIHWQTEYSKKEDLLRNMAVRIADFAERHEAAYKDIAVLARKNHEFNTLADALRENGIPVNLGAGSLLAQKETEFISSVLTLVVDDCNILAKAKIVYLTQQGNNLRNLIDSRLVYESGKKKDEGFSEEWLNDNPIVSKILMHRKEWADQSVAALIETVVGELNLRAIVKSWGDWEVREANLDKIAQLALKYEQYCQVMTFGSTTTGFLDYLNAREETSAGNEDGVVLSTYHGSKGLEWKNVILLSLDEDVDNEKSIISRSIFGIHFIRTAEPTKENLFPEMLISIMPWVWGKSNMPDDMKAVVTSGDIYNKVRSKEINESARLLYVGMTRARDRLITTAGKNGMAWISNLGIECAAIPDEGEVDLFHTGVCSVVEKPLHKDEEDEDEVFYKPFFDLYIENVDNGTYCPKYISPSKPETKEKGIVKSDIHLCDRIPLHGHPDMDMVGTCIHNIFAAMSENREEDASMAQRLITSFGYEQVLPDVLKILDARKALGKYLETAYGEKCHEYHELAFQQQEGKRIVRGSMDLVWETPKGCVLVDFKTYPGNEENVLNPEHEHYAGLYKPQLDFYRNALTAAGKKVVASCVFYPVNGLLVEIE